MRILATALYATALSAMLCSITTAQQPDGTVQLEAIPNKNTIETKPAPTLSADSDEQAEDKTEADTELDEATKLYRSLIFSIRTNNGFTIYGIPTKPDILPVSLFGAEAKIPWTSIRNIRFGDEGNVTIDLDDGSKLNGFSAVQRITLDKDWGTVTIYRDKMDTISRATQRSSSKQSSFRTPGVPYSINPQPSPVQLQRGIQGRVQLRPTTQGTPQPRR